MSNEAEPMNVEEDVAPSADPAEAVPSPPSDTNLPENPYARETEWGEDITAEKTGQLYKRILTEGSGDGRPMPDDNVIVHYTGRLLDGTVFDSSVERGEPFNFTLGQGAVIKGWDEGVATMLKGEKSLLTCKPEYAYGEKGSPPKIPANATLQFEVELLSWQGDDISKDGGVLMSMLQKGAEGDYFKPRDGTEVEVELIGSHDGRVFDNRIEKFLLGEGCEHNIIEGVELALKKMKKTERSKITVAPKYGWGHEGSQEHGVPPDATIIYEIFLIDYVKAKESWEYDTAEERKTDAERLKEKGNTFFKAGKFVLALKQYKRAADLVSESSASTDEDKELVSPIYRTVKLNEAAVHLQLKDYEKAKNACDTVLGKDEKNTKALYRRGQAYFGMQEFDSAEKDFQALIKLEPTNTAAQARLRECTDKVKMLREKEKRMYRNMFEKYAAEEERDRKESEERAKQEAAAAASAKTEESTKKPEEKVESKTKDTKPASDDDDNSSQDDEIEDSAED